mmetsp:Transcript_10866/g.14584  ORF Transcript_10866/g.14584 Transcript_10866/m.14584 type:complete len:105 (-) Transcript_10866:1674-1988(-)
MRKYEKKNSLAYEHFTAKTGGVVDCLSVRFDGLHNKIIYDLQESRRFRHQRNDNDAHKNVPKQDPCSHAIPYHYIQKHHRHCSMYDSSHPNCMLFLGFRHHSPQ